MVYVSTQSLATSSRQTLMQTQSDLANAQQELSSGKLADIGLGLGARSSTLISLDQENDRLKAINTGNTTASTRLAATVSALDNMQATAQSFLSSLITSNTDSQSIKALTLSGQGNLGAMLSMLNTAVGGQYIFGGINTGQTPMTAYTASPASTTKAAVDSSFVSAFGVSQTSPSASSIDGPSMQAYLDGAFAAQFAPGAFDPAWSAASSQAQTSEISPDETVVTSVSANSSAFAKLTQAYTMVSEFTGEKFSSGANRAVINKAAALVNSAITDLTNINVGVGITQAAISDANDRLSTQMDLLSSSSDSLISVDSYALTTRLGLLQTQINASYELTAKLQQLSLVNYIR